MRTIEEYLNLNYRLTLRRDEEGDYIAEVDELPGCIADGATPAEAIENLRDAMKSWMVSRTAAGLQIPEPRGTAEYSGRMLVRMPKFLHRRLSEHAASEGVSLNQYIVSVLSEACGRTQAIESQGATARNVFLIGDTQGSQNWITAEPTQAWATNAGLTFNTFFTRWLEAPSGYQVFENLWAGTRREQASVCVAQVRKCA